MLTICLDESGIFEDESYSLPLIIGGFVYNGEDYKDEEERLKNFYKNACIEIQNEIAIKEGRRISVDYPRGIHSTDNRVGIGRVVNKLLSKKVLAYIKKNKKYHLTAMIKTKDMVESFGEESFYNYEDSKVNTILDYTKGANLYERMATKFLYNNIFYNPVFIGENEKINLNLATRTIKVEKDSELYNELIKLNYNYKINDDGTLRFFVTGPSTFKAALSTKVYESNVNKNIDYSLNVESINYNKEGTTPFLYLADNVCEIIKETIKEIKGSFDLLKLKHLMSEKTDGEFLCFIHDDIDLIWTRLMENIMNKNLIRALENIAEIKSTSNRHNKLYIELWVPKVEVEIAKIFEKDKIDSYLATLDYYFGKENSEYEKGLFIANELLKIIDAIEDKKLRNKDYIKYKINEKIALAYNHRGAITKALEYFNICEELKSKGVSVLEYLSMRNRKTVSITNACAFENSIEELKKLLPKYEKIKDAYLDIAAEMGLESDEAYMVKEEGKILSGIAQNYAFLNKYEEAEEKFTEVLDVFTSISDKNITKSYLTHMYIEARNREKYEELIKESFNTTNLEEQCRLIFKDLKNVNRYMLFTYVKALNCLYDDVVSIELVKDLVNGISKLVKKDIDFNQHPKEMIVKHLAQLAYKKGLKVEADKLMKEQLDSIKKFDFTIKLIVEKTKIDYLNLKKSNVHVNNKVERNKFDKDIINHIENIKSHLREEELAIKVFNKFLETSSENVEECIKLLDEKVTYMYN